MNDTFKNKEYENKSDGKFDRGFGGKSGKPYEKKFDGKNGKPYGKKFDGKKPYDKKPKEEPAQGPTPSPTKIKLRLDVAEVGGKKQAPEGEDITVSEDGPTVLYEDNHVLVVVKPQNVPSQADSSGDLDFLTMLKDYLVKKYNKPGNAYLGLLHRLDRPTGGVMVFAKTSKAAARLSEQIRSGDFEKTYAAVVSGRPNRVGKVEHYLVKDEKTNTVTLAPASLTGAKRAESDIKIVDEKNGLSLVSVRLLTGRTHQARVQLKALSSPIVGDKRYGGDKFVAAPHLALWAYKLCFTHPVTEEAMKFISLPPDEFPWTEFDTDGLVDLVRPTEKRHY